MILLIRNDSVFNNMDNKTFKLPQVKIYQAKKKVQAQHSTHIFDSTIVMILFYSDNFFLFSMILESQATGIWTKHPSCRELGLNIQVIVNLAQAPMF